jgi:hypothetical protein
MGQATLFGVNEGPPLFPKPGWIEKNGQEHFLTRLRCFPTGDTQAEKAVPDTIVSLTRDGQDRRDKGLGRLVYLVYLVCLVGRTGKPNRRTKETRETR